MENYLGEIRIVSFNFAPRGWALCAGQILSIAQNQALFSILGTTYGGNGINTFALPDLRGRGPIHWGQGPGLASVTLGEAAGSAAVTLIATQVPAHTHPATFHNSTADIQGSAFDADSASPEGGYFAVPSGTTDKMYGAQANGKLSFSGEFQATGTGTLSNGGGNQPHNNMMPYLTLNFIIALQGVFPSQN